MCANSLLGRDTLTESPPVTEQTMRKLQEVVCSSPRRKSRRAEPFRCAEKERVRKYPQREPQYATEAAVLRTFFDPKQFFAYFFSSEAGSRRSRGKGRGGAMSTLLIMLQILIIKNLFMPSFFCRNKMLLPVEPTIFRP